MPWQLVKTDLNCFLKHIITYLLALRNFQNVFTTLKIKWRTKTVEYATLLQVCFFETHHWNHLLINFYTAEGSWSVVTGSNATASNSSFAISIPFGIAQLSSSAEFNQGICSTQLSFFKWQRSELLFSIAYYIVPWQNSFCVIGFNDVHFGSNMCATRSINWCLLSGGS